MYGNSQKKGLVKLFPDNKCDLKTRKIVRLVPSRELCGGSYHSKKLQAL